MRPLYVYTLFDKRTGRPRCTGFRSGKNVQIFHLFRGKGSRSIYEIFKSLSIINKMITAASERQVIVLSDFKQHLSAFGLPVRHQPYNVYDIHLPDLPNTGTPEGDEQIVRKVLARLDVVQLKDYQRVMANAAVVYQDLENRGLLVNYTLKRPIWSMKVFSGRCKTTGFNIQGYDAHDRVRSTSAGEHDILLHFDWICADIRVASILSGDKKLQATFDTGDPYTTMMEHMNAGSQDKLSRSECKQMLLEAINSMDIDSIALRDVFPDLGRWVQRCKRKASNNESLETILQRKFRVSEERNRRAILNAAMQGSVAHAMQNTLRRIWDMFPTRIIADIHDSLAMSSGAGHAEIKAMIDNVVGVMLHPFAGLLPDNPVFPVKVSIGKRWKQWRAIKVYRGNGAENVTQAVEDEEETATSVADEEEIAEEGGEGEEEILAESEEISSE